jgi:hypothetical protein
MADQSYGSETITLKVRKGVQVRVEEVDEQPRDPDERMREDRDAHVELPLDLKVAVKRVPLQDEAAIKPVVVTMCG